MYDIQNNMITQENTRRTLSSSASTFIELLRKRPVITPASSRHSISTQKSIKRSSTQTNLHLQDNSK